MPTTAGAAANSNVSNFMGNVNAQGWSGKDGSATKAADIFGAATGAAYSGIALAAKETGRLPGPVGYVGTVVNIAVGVATGTSADSVSCNLLGVGAGAVGGIAGAAGAVAVTEWLTAGFATPLEGWIATAGYAGGTFVGGLLQKGVTAACQTAIGFVNGEAPATPVATQFANTQALQNMLAVAPPAAFPSVNSVPASAAGLAAEVVKFRPSPDYTGNAGVYTVQNGQTLSGIAAANGISLSTLTATNPQITDPNSIRAGQVIQLPPSASGYVSGPADPNASIPNGAAQAATLTRVMQQDAGTTIDAVAENTGQIAVLSPTTGMATIIADNGSSTHETLAQFNSQAQQQVNNYVSGGYLSGNSMTTFSDYADNISGTTSLDGLSGTIITNTGTFSKDSSGDIAAETLSGNLFAFDNATSSVLLAADSGGSATLAADTQAHMPNGSLIDDSKTYATTGAVEGEAVETTSGGVSSVAFSGNGSVTGASNVALAYPAGSTATVSGSNDSVSDGTGSTMTLSRTGDTFVGNSDTVNIAAQGLTLQMSGNNNTVDSAWDTINLVGANTSLTARSTSGSGWNIFNISNSGDNIKASGENFKLSGAGLSLSLTGERNSIIDGGGETYNLGGNTAVQFYGPLAAGGVRSSGDTINVTGNNDELTSRGPDTYNLATSGLNCLIQGPTPSVPVSVNATGDTIDLVGSSTMDMAGASTNDVININATGDTVAAANGDTFAISGRYSDPTLGGNNDTVNATNEMINFIGSNDKLAVSGSNYIEVNGTGDNITASNDTVQLTGSNETVTVNGTQDKFGIVGGATNDTVIEDLSNGSSIVAHDSNGSSWSVTDYSGSNGTGAVDGGYTTGTVGGSGGDSGGTGGDAPVTDAPPDNGGYYYYSASATTSALRRSNGHADITAATAHDRAVTQQGTGNATESHSMMIGRSNIATPESANIGHAASFINDMPDLRNTRAPAQHADLVTTANLRSHVGPSVPAALPMSIGPGDFVYFVAPGTPISSPAMNNLVQSMAAFGAAPFGSSPPAFSEREHNMMLSHLFSGSQTGIHSALR